MNAIHRAADALGGYEATGRICNVSGKAVMKWARRGRLPRTEWTGETDYAARILAALKAKGRGDLLSLDDLLCIPSDPSVIDA